MKAVSIRKETVKLHLFGDDMVVIIMNQNYPKAIPELINTFRKVVGYMTN